MDAVHTVTFECYHSEGITLYAVNVTYGEVFVATSADLNINKDTVDNIKIVGSDSEYRWCKETQVLLGPLHGNPVAIM